MLFVFAVPHAHSEIELILNTNVIQIGDNEPDLQTSWTKDFNIPKRYPINAQLSVECRHVHNGDQPIIINGIRIGQLWNTDMDIFSTFKYSISNGVLIEGNNAISISTSLVTAYPEDYDDLYFRSIKLTYSVDSDGDEIADALDNCPDISNPDQIDADGDGVGNLCDNCPEDSNANQNDTDEDELGDVCDNCPDISNTDQLNDDNDTHGNACDNCPDIDNEDQEDTDEDGIGDMCDNCPDDPNIDQLDTDGDGRGDVCDLCPAWEIFGENSEEVHILRLIKENVLTQTPEGREIIRLYYEWSPAIVKAIEADPQLKEEIKEMIDEVIGVYN